jgi:FG-GAP repeat
LRPTTILLAAACSAGCVSEGAVLGEPELPHLAELADAVLRGPQAMPGLDRVAVAGDLDGDGSADIIAYAAASSSLHIRHGTADFPADESLACAITFDASIQVAAVGDVDGDARADLLVSTPSTCRTHVVYGSESGLCGAVPSAEILTPCGESAIGHGVGDVDGDGLADFVIAPVGGGAALFHGRTARFPAELSASDADATLLAGEGDADFGLHVAPAGDTDGDGRSDFFITTTIASLLYRGPPARFSGPVPPDRAAARLVDGSIGIHAPAGLGDLDRDGRGDFALNGFASLYSIYYGRDAVDGVPDAALVGTHAGSSGQTIRTGDLDGDGALDIAIGDPDLFLGEMDGPRGGVHILYGGTGRLSGSVSLVERSAIWRAGAPGQEAATAIAVGDVDGDGIDDLAVASPGARAVYIVLGGPRN